MACATASSSSSLHSLSSSSSTSHTLPRRHFHPCHLTFRRPLPVISASCATPAPRASSFYDLLGVEDGAACTEIKAAYRRLARSLHPDLATSSRSEEFIRVHEAYATLSDPAKRADYDMMLFFKRRRSGSSPNYYNLGTTNAGTPSYSRFSGYTRRTWETDQCW